MFKPDESSRGGVQSIFQRAHSITISSNSMNPARDFARDFHLCTFSSYTSLLPPLPIVESLRIPLYTPTTVDTFARTSSSESNGIDEPELLCERRALAAFRLDPKEWGVNTRPCSINAANRAAMAAILQPQDRVLDFPILNNRNSEWGVYESGGPGHGIIPANGEVAYEHLASQVESSKPHLIMCGTSAYPRNLDYATVRAVADSVGASVIADISHISGFVAAQELDGPFEHCDIVTTATERSLGGPRGGLIFFRKSHPNARDLYRSSHVPHSETIAAMSTALERVCKPEWMAHAKQTLHNTRVLANTMMVYGYRLLTGGTDTDFIIWDLRPQNLAGSKLQTLLDMIGLTLEVAHIPGETALQSPHGVRLSTSLLTAHNMKEKDIQVVATFLHRAVELCVRLQRGARSKLLEDFIRVAADRKDSTFLEVQKLAKDLRRFKAKWPRFGIDAKKRSRCLCVN